MWNVRGQRGGVAPHPASIGGSWNWMRNHNLLRRARGARKQKRKVAWGLRMGFVMGSERHGGADIAGFHSLAMEPGLDLTLGGC